MKITSSKKKRILFPFLIMLSFLVLLSGCLDADPSSTTPTATPEPTQTAAPEQTLEPTEKPSESMEGEMYQYKTGICIQTSETQGNYKTDLLIKLGHNRKFTAKPRHEIAVYQGQTIRFRNSDTRLNTRFLLHSPHGNFENFLIMPRYDCYMTFPEIGVYDIELMNGTEYQNTGKVKPFDSGSSVLTVFVVPNT